MNLIIPICVGVALAAACGFRVFLPLLAMSVAAHTGWAHPTGPLQWVNSNAGLTVLSVATAVEVAGYYIPWVDHALDVIASPAAVTAGTLVVASMLPGTDPALQWAFAIIAGGGSAAVFQAGTVTARAASGLSTAGFGNPVVSTIELIFATVLSILAIVLPILAAMIVGFFLVVIMRKILSWRRRRRVQCEVMIVSDLPPDGSSRAGGSSG